MDLSVWVERQQREEEKQVEREAMSHCIQSWLSLEFCQE